MPEDYTGWNRNPKRGPGRPRKESPPESPPALVAEKTEHVIHSDGTYSNDRTETTLDKLKAKMVKDVSIVFGVGPYSWSGTVHKVVKNGVFLRPNRHVEVDISRCTFYSWDELLTNMARIP